MLVPTRAVHVAVGNLLPGGRTHLQNLHIEGKLLSGKRMVGVDIRRVSARLGDRNRNPPLPGVELHHHTGTQLAPNTHQVFHRDPLDLVRVGHAVGIGRRHGGTEYITGSVAGHGLFQSRNNIADAVKISGRLAAPGVLQLVAGRIPQRVVENDDGIWSDIQAAYPLCVLEGQIIRCWSIVASQDKA